MESNQTEEGWRRFLELSFKLSSIDQLSELFHLFLTHEERDAIALRVMLVSHLLDQKQSQQLIAKQLGISLSKMTRGSNAMKIISPQLREYLKVQLIAPD